MSDTTTAEDRCRGFLIGLAAGDRFGGPIRMAVRLAESLLDRDGFHPADILNRYLAWWLTLTHEVFDMIAKEGQRPISFM
jgi:ADP-ribosylglycohydrolase